MAFNLSLTDPFERIANFWDIMTTLRLGDGESADKYWDHELLTCMKPLSSVVHPRSAVDSNGVLSTTRWLLDVKTLFCNRNNVLHGGCVATAFDMATSVSLASVAVEGKFSWLGVSRSLNCTYLKAIPEGTAVVIVCEVMNIGSRMASIRGHMREWVRDEKEGLGGRETGVVLATCEHDKANTDVKL